MSSAMLVVAHAVGRDGGAGRLRAFHDAHVARGELGSPGPSPCCGSAGSGRAPCWSPPRAAARRSSIVFSSISRPSRLACSRLASRLASRARAALQVALQRRAPRCRPRHAACPGRWRSRRAGAPCPGASRPGVSETRACSPAARPRGAQAPGPPGSTARGQAGELGGRQGCAPGLRQRLLGHALHARREHGRLQAGHCRRRCCPPARSRPPGRSAPGSRAARCSDVFHLVPLLAQPVRQPARGLAGGREAEVARLVDVGLGQMLLATCAASFGS